MNDKRRIWYSFLVLATILFTSCHGTRQGVRQDDPADVSEQTLLEEASGKATEGEYNDALAIFHQILEENPTSSEAYLGIGDIYLEQSDYTRAEPALARAAKLSPRNFDAQFRHGLALQMLDRFLEAIQAYHRALTIDPDSADANRNLASAYLRLQEPRNALPFAKRAVALDPADGTAWVSLGAAWEGMEDWTQAADAYVAASERMEPTPELMRNLLRMLAKLKRYREVISTAETIQRFGPDAESLERSGWASFRLGEYDVSLKSYRSAVTTDATMWQAWNGIGVNRLNAYLLSNREDNDAFMEAGNAFRQSLRANSDQPKVIDLMLKYQL